MDQLGLRRYCCRRMVMTHVDLIEKLLKYVTTPITQPHMLNSLRDLRAEILTLSFPGIPPTDATSGRTN